jgi:hypothetical protein
MPQQPIPPSRYPNSASDERGYQRIRVRQDTRDNWLKNDPVLAAGEFGYVIGATDPGETIKIGDGTVRWSNLPWLMATGNSGPPGPPGLDGEDGSVAIVAVVEPPPQELTGTLWINPAELPGEVLVTDVLAAIRGQVIAPKAIDLDGPHTLFITSNLDGSAKLTLRVDGTPLRAITEESVATEDWVLANSGGIHVGPTAPGNSNILWLNPTGVGGGIAPTVEPPFVVSELAPLTTSSIWINPKG